MEGDCEEIEIWYNPDGDACNCNGDEYDTGVREYEGNCQQQTTTIILPSSGTGGMNTSLPPYYYPLIGIGGGVGGNNTPSNTPYIPINYFTPAHFLLTGQLNLILGAGDTYYFTATGDPNQSFSFNTAGEFQIFLNTNNTSQTFDITTPSTTINQIEKIEHAKINLIGIGGIDISCKLYKSGNLWQVTNVSSTEYGLTISWSWEQLPNYTTSILGNEIVLNVEGYIKYNVFLEGLGTVYKQKQKYIIKIDTQTGLITSLAKG